MKFQVKAGNWTQAAQDLVIVVVPEGQLLKWAKKQGVSEMAAVARQAAGSVEKASEFRGAAGETLLVHLPQGVAARRLLAVGAGPVKELNAGSFRLAVALGARWAAQKGLSRVGFVLELPGQKALDEKARTEIAVETFLLATYKFTEYLEDAGKHAAPDQVTLWAASGRSLPGLQKAAAYARTVGEAVCWTRDTNNQPGNKANPAYLASLARKAGRDFPSLHCTVLGPSELKKLGMGGILGVGAGSEQPPQLIVLDYRPARRLGPTVGLVGKGITFDSGGISLKPGQGMEWMRFDKSGAVAVLGTMRALAALKLPLRVVGVMACAENMPSGSAIRPGDILRTHSGKTVEVLNTDAEGRLVLADALSYIGKYKPDVVVDLATLTGACVVALGNEAAGLFSQDTKLVDQLVAAGTRTGDRVWPMPLWPEYGQMIKGDAADLKNIGGRDAGAITAAAFLQNFVQDYRWAHLDIAGTGWTEKGKPTAAKGATGFGVRLLLDWMQHLAGRKV
ncbi:MAG: leucyl aminopeptidase [Candidatus Omnitrophica bacterium]|nr:leucyl aminopeptidase [Candidatus Omnitrophota bacterium]